MTQPECCAINLLLSTLLITNYIAVIAVIVLGIVLMIIAVVDLCKLCERIGYVLHWGEGIRGLFSDPELQVSCKVSS